MRKYYVGNVGEIKQQIRESVQEFKPVIGDNVQSDNKKTNDKSYKDIEKAVKNFDGGLQEPKKNKLEAKTDGNKTTLDYTLRMPASKEFKDRVKAQAQGYTSTLEKNNGIEKAADFDDEGRIFKQFTDANKENNKKKKDLEKSGLQSRELKDYIKDKETMYENIKPKRLKFNHTRFMSENYMLARIPEEYKKDGQIVYMQDKTGDEYKIICEKNQNGTIETNIVGYNNKQLMTEQMSRIHELFNYKPKDYSGKNVKPLNEQENKTFQSLLEQMRKNN